MLVHIRMLDKNAQLQQEAVGGALPHTVAAPAGALWFNLPAAWSPVQAMRLPSRPSLLSILMLQLQQDKHGFAARACV